MCVCVCGGGGKGTAENPLQLVLDHVAYVSIMIKLLIFRLVYDQVVNISIWFMTMFVFHWFMIMSFKFKLVYDHVIYISIVYDRVVYILTF